MNDPIAVRPLDTGFATTRWSQVLLAGGDGPEAHRALSELCGIYYRPVHRFLEGRGRDTEAARELTHQFFAKLLTGPGIDGVHRGQGRFRSYLLGALKHFLADQWDYEHRAKRGGGAAQESLAEYVAGSDTSPGLELPDSNILGVETVFDRDWAVTLMAYCLRRLQEEYSLAGKARQFDVLKVWLMGEIPELSQAEAGESLGLSEGAFKVAVHRVRKRFRELIRLEIAQTVDGTAAVEEELRYFVDIMVRYS